MIRSRAACILASLQHPPAIEAIEPFPRRRRPVFMDNGPGLLTILGYPVLFFEKFQLAADRFPGNPADVGQTRGADAIGGLGERRPLRPHQVGNVYLPDYGKDQQLLHVAIEFARTIGKMLGQKLNK